jgi:hypothetical protein
MTAKREISPIKSEVSRAGWNARLRGVWDTARASNPFEWVGRFAGGVQGAPIIPWLTKVGSLTKALEDGLMPGSTPKSEDITRGLDIMIPNYPGAKRIKEKLGETIGAPRDTLEEDK